jgi:hypothetical protein
MNIIRFLTEKGFFDKKLSINNKEDLHTTAVSILVNTVTYIPTARQ